MKSALEGVRILDFTWAWAGPFGTTLLALMGAEVIKVESSSRLDHSRLRSMAAGPVACDKDESPPFNCINLGKLSIRLSLKKPEAIELVKKLIKHCDVVTQNFRPGVLDKLGLGYESLKAVKPDIILVSSSALGSSGPEKSYIGYAPTFAALGGLANTTGYPDGRPNTMTGSVDLRSATAFAFAILGALYYKSQTGKGQHVDLCSREVVTTFIGDDLMDYSMNKRVNKRRGNHDRFMAPHNVYPCQGEDSWISVAVSNDEEWRSLCETMGNPPWTKDSKFADGYNRWKNQEELDMLIGEWTKNYPADYLMHLLQKASVAAVPSFSNKDLFNDPHVRVRDYFQQIKPPKMEKRYTLGPPWKFSATPAQISRPAPTFGEHEEYVFGQLLGLSLEEIERLREAQVIY